MTFAKRTTIYLDPNLLKALRIKSLKTSHSMSELVNEAVALTMAEDAADLTAFKERAHETLITFKAVRNDLKRHGKI